MNTDVFRNRMKVLSGSLNQRGRGFLIWLLEGGAEEEVLRVPECQEVEDHQDRCLNHQLVGELHPQSEAMWQILLPRLLTQKKKSKRPKPQEESQWPSQVHSEAQRLPKNLPLHSVGKLMQHKFPNLRNQIQKQTLQYSKRRKALMRQSMKIDLCKYRPRRVINLLLLRRHHQRLSL